MDTQGKLVKIYWNKDRRCVLNINGEETILSPWIGVQLEEWRDNGRDWKRADITKYEPVDLLGWLERTGQHIAPVRKTARLK